MELPDTIYACDVCGDTGVEVVVGKGARPCGCQKAAQRERLLARIPSQFQTADLATLTPMPNKHPKQAEALAKIKANPAGNFFLAGHAGTGKTVLMWALYRHAIERSETHPVVCSLSELLDEYRAEIRASKNHEEAFRPRLTASMLRTKTRYSIFLDDIDKANPTDYAAEQIFALVNAIYEEKHQLVITTNKTVTRLIAHYDKSDDRGEPIVRRMLDGATRIEMF